LLEIRIHPVVSSGSGIFTTGSGSDPVHLYRSIILMLNHPEEKLIISMIYLLGSNTSETTFSMKKYVQTKIGTIQIQSRLS
jgi:hypothetical protein